MSTDLIKRATVEELVGHRNRAIEQYDAMIAASDAMETAFKRACTATGTEIGGGYIEPSFRPRKDRERFVRELDGKCWRNLANMTKIAELMDVEERRKFDKQISEAPIEITVDNVIATLTRLIGDAGAIFNRSVVATFESLPRTYRSNDGFKFGKRIIFQYAFTGSKYWCKTRGRNVTWLSWNHYSNAEDRLRDLDRVFHMVDGKSLPEGGGDALTAVRKGLAERGEQAFEGESTYFHVKGHLNGTLHVWPKDKALTARVNQILARHYGWALGDVDKKHRKAA